MVKTDLKSLVDKSNETFAKYGLPNKIVSDNSLYFVALEFREFCNYVMVLRY